mmetsp:Transcript_27813/g.43164  ORF Transcript_27813/g.43164 Transcript_27813/m.43164 type:complete len:360 (-) Transcript_27813:168-1247(-)
MQFVTSDDRGMNSSLSDLLTEATKRSAHVRSTFKVISESDSFKELAEIAQQSNSFADMEEGGVSYLASWCVRVRQLDRTRFGKTLRSPLSREREATAGMTNLLQKFGGKVNLRNPDEMIYIFEGLTARKKFVLCRKLADGLENMSSIAPTTRKCVTSTPLRPSVAVSMANIAKLQKNFNVLDPYAGSCSTLLAAALVEPTCKTVGIERAHGGIVSFMKIQEDFAVRNFTSPSGLIRGDSRDIAVRNKAIEAISGEEFDAILTDPPYGIREKVDEGCPPPLVELFQSIIEDRERGKRLLRVGGRIIAFCPNRGEDDLMDKQSELPSKEQMDRAGIKLVAMMKQPMNESLSRFLVVFECIK